MFLRQSTNVCFFKYLTRIFNVINIVIIIYVALMVSNAHQI